MSDDERQIRALIERWAQAVHAADMDGVQCPASEVRESSRRPLTRTSEAKGHWQTHVF
jgi:hypothetical protein